MFKFCSKSAWSIKSYVRKHAHAFLHDFKYKIHAFYQINFMFRAIIPQWLMIVLINTNHWVWFLTATCVNFPENLSWCWPKGRVIQIRNHTGNYLTSVEGYQDRTPNVIVARIICTIIVTDDKTTQVTVKVLRHAWYGRWRMSLWLWPY